MTTNMQAPAIVSHPLKDGPPGSPWPPPPSTTEERLEGIKKMGLRINNYIQFMCNIANLQGTSEEAKMRTVKSFHDRLVLVDRQLAKIQEDVQLG